MRLANCESATRRLLRHLSRVDLHPSASRPCADAYLSSLVPLSNRVPVYHAEAAQLALDELFRECDGHRLPCSLSAIVGELRPPAGKGEKSAFPHLRAASRHRRADRHSPYRTRFRRRSSRRDVSQPRLLGKSIFGGTRAVASSLVVTTTCTNTREGSLSLANPRPLTWHWGE